jgi:hypothetical protein
MQNFIVLGLVPGTHIQINFIIWLGLVLSLPAIAACRIVWHHRQALVAFILWTYARWATHDWRPSELSYLT